MAHSSGAPRVGHPRQRLHQLGHRRPRAAGGIDTQLALKGTGPDVRTKVMSNLSERAAGNLAEEIDLLGPVRLKDVEEARDNVVKVIRSLEESDQIVLTRGTDEFVE